MATHPVRPNGRSTASVHTLLLGHSRSRRVQLFAPAGGDDGGSAVLRDRLPAASKPRLDNHLRDTLAAERLAADKGLALDAGQQVADGGEREEDTRGDEGAAAEGDADEHDGAHDAVGGRAHVVGRDLADELVKLGRGRADAEEQRHFDEEDQEGECAGRVSVKTIRHSSGHPHGKSAEDDEADVKGKDGRDARCQADDHGQDAQPAIVSPRSHARGLGDDGRLSASPRTLFRAARSSSPLSVDACGSQHYSHSTLLDARRLTEVSRLELLFERHVEGFVELEARRLSVGFVLSRRRSALGDDGSRGQSCDGHGRLAVFWPPDTNSGGQPAQGSEGPVAERGATGWRSSGDVLGGARGASWAEHEAGGHPGKLGQ
ncbi:hypothetical protein ACCO45_004071 [Purpureocillium lilacinum]|uniref:Uncharacterized protein n=1 Tax=Purpureocillium lilacinum TaxID=33203 RepID=A0ACC4E2J3_PURLI